MISSSLMVPYRDRRLCSGATFPVLLVNCHGGSARMVANRRPFAKLTRSSAAAGRVTDVSGPSPPSVFDVGRLPDSENNDRASPAASAVKPRTKFRHVGRGGAIARASSWIVEYGLQFGAARDDDTGIDRAQIEQQPKIVQVAVEEGVFVVPFHFQGHAVLVAFDVVHDNSRIESLFGPPELGIRRRVCPQSAICGRPG